MMEHSDIIKRIDAKLVLRDKDVTPLTTDLCGELIRYARNAEAFYATDGKAFNVEQFIENYRFYSGACGCMGPRGFSYCNCKMGLLLEEYKWEVLLAIREGV